MGFIRYVLLLIQVFSAAVYAARYSNALKSSNGADPNIVSHDRHYYLMSTTEVDLQMTRATTLEGLKEGEHRQVYKETMDHSRMYNFWAPEMHQIDGVWYIYYAAGPQQCCGEQHAHVLKGGASPWDAFTYLGQVRPDWSVDLTLLTINDQDYVVYSGHDRNNAQVLRIAPRLSPVKTGKSTIISSPTNAWERANNLAVNEGPFALYSKGKTWLSFSASHCSSSAYALGLLAYRGGDPTQIRSWAKSNGPVFASANGNFGPGHNSFFTSPDGAQTWNVYHSTPKSGGQCGADRFANAAIVGWKEDGTPDFGAPPKDGLMLDGPSGE